MQAVSLFAGCGGADLGILGGFNYLDKYYCKNRIKIIQNNKKKYQYPSLNQIYSLMKFLVINKFVTNLKSKHFDVTYTKMAH